MKKTLLVILTVFAVVAALEMGLRLRESGIRYFSVGKDSSNREAASRQGTYRIMCLGDSATTDEYPALLEEELNRKNTGIRFSIIDKGRNGLNMNTILLNLDQYIAQYKPDMVITMIGGLEDKNNTVVFEYEETGSSYKKLKTYKLMKLIHLHLKIKIGEIKNAAGGIAGKIHESIEKLGECKWLEMKPTGIGRGESTTVLGNKSSYLEKGHYYRDTGNYKEAEAMYKKAVSVDPLDEKAYLGLADSYGKLGRYEEADRMCNKAIEINPKNEQGYLHLAYWYKKQERYKEAEYLLRKTIELNPGNSWGYITLGDLCIEQKKYKEAENLFRKAIEINPKNETGFIFLADCCRAFGKYKEAEKLYRKGIELNPKNPIAYKKVGEWYTEQKRYKEAEALYRKMAKLNPNDGKLYINLANCYMSQGKLKEAEELFRKVEEKYPNYGETYINLANCYMSQGKLKEAEDQYMRAKKIDPKQKTAFYFFFSKIYASQNRYDKVAKRFKEMMRQQDENDMKSGVGASYLYEKDMEIKYKIIKDEFKSLYYSPGTVYNFKKLRKTLKEKNITYVCVQYPMREVTDLKGIFEGDKSIVFVDNEKIFKEGVKKEGYYAYFRDLFGDEVGHCTVKGNKLLAANIANTIIREVFSPAGRDVANLNSR